MIRPGWSPIVAALISVGWAGVVPAAQTHQADVVVYGGSAGGVIAAVAAAREGKSAILVEPGRHVGGMVSGGLGATDHGNRRAIGGISREFFRRVHEHYVAKYGADSPQAKDSSDGFRFEPRVALGLFREMLAEAKISVVTEAGGLASVTMDGKRIASIRTANGDTFSAPVFIDASYEGDVMARAGVKYHVGREGKAEYGETLAGVQARSAAHQFSVPVPARRADGKPLPTVQAEPPGAPGEGDRKVQAYNYRLCMTDRADNRVPFPKPAGYDPSRFELLARYLALKPGLTPEQVLSLVRIPNGKTDTNNNGAISTDHIGANWDYPDADDAARRAIIADHIAYTQGLLYFLANDERVPKPLHDQMARWGLAADEFVDTDHWPHQLYVREARRMIGVYVMTQADIMEERTKLDAVGLGSYNTDSHHVQRFIQPDGTAFNEGDFQVRVSPYAIPYRSLLPKPDECANLLVPVCLSASHVAYGTIRMEPVYMIVGQACGVAASLAVDGKVPVQGVPVDTLVAKLKAQGAVLSPENFPVSPPRAGNIDATKLPGVVVDDARATLTGGWRPSTSNTPYVGEGYVHDGKAADPGTKIRFTPNLPAAGEYEVRLFFPPDGNRATNATVVIHSEGKDHARTVNQRSPAKGATPVSLGVFEFAKGEAGWVEIRSGGADGYVVADAVQFLPAP
ncbi:FAD-dependent oxidoreductase [Tundrisphaera sp. TA3]|uniref:FAD-dependent oxidoreductase n=1 Tax=Tundrisphaera sp. TA3 TaxID=3435775 RepID=UPI003EBE58D6